MSELSKWFESRRARRTLNLMQRHIALTMGAVEDLERAVQAAADDDEDTVRRCSAHVSSAEKEADNLRREMMSELAHVELASTVREDLMHLVKRIDNVADWSNGATRILCVIPTKEIPEKIKTAYVEMARIVKQCTVALQRCINLLINRSAEALEAADRVERLEEEVDALHAKTRELFVKEKEMRAGVAVLLKDLLDSIEMVSDYCEDTCDQVRVIIVRGL